jgi:hypothetical protein
MYHQYNLKHIKMSHTIILKHSSTAPTDQTKAEHGEILVHHSASAETAGLYIKLSDNSGSLERIPSKTYVDNKVSGTSTNLQGHIDKIATSGESTDAQHIYQIKSGDLKNQAYAKGIAAAAAHTHSQYLETGHDTSATTASTGHVKISNGDVNTIPHADGLVAGMDHTHGNYTEKTTFESHVDSEAGANTLGHVKVGNFLSASTDGTLSVKTGTTNSTVAVGNHTHASSSITDSISAETAITSGATGLVQGKAVYEYAPSKGEFSALSNQVDELKDEFDLMISGSGLTEAIDSLKEVSEWIGDNEKDATSIVSSINNLDKIVSGYTSASTNTIKYHIDEIKEDLGGVEERVGGLETSVVKKIKVTTSGSTTTELSPANGVIDLSNIVINCGTY